MKMVDKTVAIAVVLSIILSTALSFGVIMKVPQVQEFLCGPRLDKKTFSVNIGFDYGNGTINWFNDTQIDIGDGIMSATLQVVDADYELSDGWFYLRSLEGFKGGEWRRIWWFTYYDRKEDWSAEYYPEGWSDQWRGEPGFSFLVPLPDGFTCKWIWTTWD